MAAPMAIVVRSQRVKVALDSGAGALLKLERRASTRPHTPILRAGTLQLLLPKQLDTFCSGVCVCLFETLHFDLIELNDLVI